MFDIGGWEFLVIIVVAIVVIGPKDLPATIRTVTGWIRRARELARDFQSGLDDLAREAELDGVKNDIQSGLGLEDMRDTGNSIRNEIEQSIDPRGEISDAFKDDDAPLGPDDPLSDPYLEEDEDPVEPAPPRHQIASSDLQSPEADFRSAKADAPAATHSGELPPDDEPPPVDEEPAGAAKKA
jgi:sec-independent protein translocase protein TatB